MKRRISIALKRRWELLSPEAPQKIALAAAAIGKANKGRKMSKDFCAVIRITNLSTKKSIGRLHTGMRFVIVILEWSTTK